MRVFRWRLVDCIEQLNLVQLYPVTHNYYLPFTEEVVVGFTVAAVMDLTPNCAVSSAVDVNDAAPDDTGMVVVEDAWTPIDVPLSDPTVIFGRGNTIDVITLENPSFVVIALDTGTADATVTFTDIIALDTSTADSTVTFWRIAMLEDCATELLPKKKCAIEKTTLLALKQEIIENLKQRRTLGSLLPVLSLVR